MWRQMCYLGRERERAGSACDLCPATLSSSLLLKEEPQGALGVEEEVDGFRLGERGPD